MTFTVQQQFHIEWGGLRDPHVRALAWLLSSPHLLNNDTPIWNGANIAPALPGASGLSDFLHALDRDPAALYAALALHPTRRLGLYAEALLAFYLSQLSNLYAHGLQIHDDKSRTIGEFDFLVQNGQSLSHWELATKFYLFFQNDIFESDSKHADLFDYLGPNLADTLGAKMHKIVNQQLRLSEHPQARVQLPFPVTTAQALIKGWLFYRKPLALDVANLVDGVAADHCRGYIWQMSDFYDMEDFSGVILDRLMWLAPVQLSAHKVFSKEQLIEQVGVQFTLVKTPVVLAITEMQNGYAREVCRGMVVPDNWWRQAVDARKRLAPLA
ncbi:DUF1853 family protein [Undibacterium sp. Dicai25W]|uniref:DUF1853 family protein n=1 Tax=Undibacterium sp. Dicai25W TaxID=3413034 RepID=UPI003BF3B441